MNEQEFWNSFQPSLDKPDCRVWTRALNSCGYGEVIWYGQNWGTHRLVWSLLNGQIPRGINVLHTCDNPACGRIEHLFLGTHTDNMKDMKSKGRNVYYKGEMHGRAKLTR